ncbi:MAG: hypothetical protein KC516_02265 [Nanoarchaeota archaeon]|nr:hypothetical protein [Nanoarchaeota archaeon]
MSFNEAKFRKYFNRKEDISDLKKYLKIVNNFKKAIDKNEVIKGIAKKLIKGRSEGIFFDNLGYFDEYSTACAPLEKMHFEGEKITVGLKIRHLEDKVANEAVSTKALLYTSSGTYSVPPVSIIKFKHLEKEFLAYFVQYFQLIKGVESDLDREILKITEKKGISPWIGGACAMINKKGKELPVFFDTDHVQSNIDYFSEPMKSRLNFIKDILNSEEYVVNLD